MNSVGFRKEREKKKNSRLSILRGDQKIDDHSMKKPSQELIQVEKSHQPSHLFSIQGGGRGGEKAASGAFCSNGRSRRDLPLEASMVARHRHGWLLPLKFKFNDGETKL